MGPIWGLQDLGGPHIDPMNFAIWEDLENNKIKLGMYDYNVLWGYCHNTTQLHNTAPYQGWHMYWQIGSGASTFK